MAPTTLSPDRREVGFAPFSRSPALVGHARNPPEQERNECGGNGSGGFGNGSAKPF